MIENVDSTKPYYRCKACGETAVLVTDDTQCACERSEPLKGEWEWERIVPVGSK